MICLAIDTSGKTCAACLYDSASKTVLAEISEEIGKGHAERLMGIIGDVMQMADVTYPDINKIITTIGPGSFTGIRVGVATARGFAIGLNVPVVGINNLEAILYQHMQHEAGSPAANYGVVIDANRGQIYCLLSFESNFAPAHTPFVTEFSELQTALADKADLTLWGDASGLFMPQVENKNSASTQTSQASIKTIAEMGAQRDESTKKPEPLYLRKPDAVPQKGFAVERKG